MYKILILGGKAREVVLVKQLTKEKNDVYIMTENKSPEIDDLNVKFYKEFFDEDIVKKIKPDIVFAFADEYVLNKEVNDKIHQVCKNCLIIMPKYEYCKLESDKTVLRNMLGNSVTGEIKRISKAEAEKCLENGEELFIRERNKNYTKCHICKNKNNLNKISFTDSKVYAEKYFDGKNVTVTVYVNKNKFVIFPTVYDYPFIEKEYLLKTGGVKCDYNICNEKKDHLNEVVVNIINKINKNIGNDYVGFLALQLIVSNDKFYFVEVDIRPGEPEFINVINAIDEDITNIFTDTPDNFYNIKAKNNVSRSIALAGKDYPFKNSVNFSLNKDLNNNNGVVYWSKCEVKEDKAFNYDNGRVAFIYFEADDPAALDKNIDVYLNENKEFFNENNLCFYI